MLVDVCILIIPIRPREYPPTLVSSGVSHAKILCYSSGIAHVHKEEDHGWRSPWTRRLVRESAITSESSEKI
jgi:hypothetical protein